MPLFRDTTSPIAGTVFSDLYSICSQDGHLGEVPSIYPDAALVTYSNPTVTTAAAKRLSYLVHQPTSILITGLEAGTYVPTPAGPQLIDHMGYTLRTSLGALGSHLEVWYDASLCGGQGVWAVGADGASHVNCSGPVILYHELIHVDRIIQGTYKSDWNTEESETAVEENDFRRANGVPLRSTTDHNVGCGPPTDPHEPQPSFWSDVYERSCFVVGAAYPEPQPRMIDGLRYVRDGLLRHTHAGRRFFDAMHREYYLISPAIAAEMRADHEIRALVRAALVEPFVILIAVLASGLEPGRLTEMPSATSLAERLRHAADSVGQECAAAMAADFDALAAHSIDDAYASPIGRYVGTHLRRVRRPLPLLAATFFWPLAAWWRAVAMTAAGPVATQSLMWDIEHWVVELTLPWIDTTADRDQLLVDLSLLRNGVFATSRMHAAIAGRLAARAAEDAELKASLAKFGYWSV